MARQMVSDGALALLGRQEVRQESMDVKQPPFFLRWFIKAALWAQKHVIGPLGRWVEKRLM